MANTKTLDKHHNHKVVILPRYHKGKPRLIPGLYCETCACLIKWLKPAHALELEGMGVDRLSPIQRDLDLLRKEQQNVPYTVGGWK